MIATEKDDSLIGRVILDKRRRGKRLYRVDLLADYQNFYLVGIRDEDAIHFYARNDAQHLFLYVGEAQIWATVAEVKEWLRDAFEDIVNAHCYEEAIRAQTRKQI